MEINNIPQAIKSKKITKSCFDISNQAGQLFNLLNQEKDKNYVLYKKYNIENDFFNLSRKNRNNKLIDVTTMNADSFGFLVERVVKKKPYIGSTLLNYHEYFPLYKEIKCEDRAFALYLKTNKYKIPCGLHVSMIKN